MPAKLTKEEAHAFLDARLGWLILTTIGPDGFPHTVPVGFFRVGDEIYAGGRSSTQRVRNVKRNPKVSALVETGNSMDTIKGVMVQGEADIVDEPDATLKLMRDSMTARGAPEHALPTEPRPDVAYIRIRPTNYITWDYSREE